MYKYTVKKGIQEHAPYYYGTCRWIKYEWITANIKPLVDDWQYHCYHAFRDINLVAYYSPVRLTKVPLNGVLFPVRLFDEQHLRRKD